MEFFLIVFLGGHGVIMPERYPADQCKEAGHAVQLTDTNGPRVTTPVFACVPAPTRAGCSTAFGSMVDTIPCDALVSK